MKNASLKVLSVIILLLLMTYLFQSCSKETVLTPDQTRGITIEKEFSYNGLFKFPKGTYLEIKDNKLHYKLPDGYKLITLIQSDNDPQGRIGGGNSGHVECECTGKFNGGCYPGIDTRNGNVFCMPNSQCDGDCLVKSSSGNRSAELINATVVNLKATNHLVEDNALGNWSKEFIYRDLKVQEHMTNFLNLYTTPQERLMLNKKGDLPEGFLYAPASFLGGLVYVPVRESVLASNKEIGGTRTYDCQCTDPDIPNKACNLRGRNGLIWCSSRVCKNCKLIWTD